MILLDFDGTSIEHHNRIIASPCYIGDDNVSQDVMMMKLEFHLNLEFRLPSVIDEVK